MLYWVLVFKYIFYFYRFSGFTVRQLVDFGLSALQHQNSEVRKVGERLLITLYGHCPVVVRKALPLEDEPARKNVLYRNLFEQLEELDKKVATVSRLANVDKKCTAIFRAKFKHFFFSFVSVRLGVPRLGKVRLVQLS